MKDTQREAETQVEGEVGSWREPDEGLDPETPGSHPALKAGAKWLSHPGIPNKCILSFFKKITDTIKLLNRLSDAGEQHTKLIQFQPKAKGPIILIL